MSGVLGGMGWNGGRSQCAENLLLIILRSLLERRKIRRDLISLATDLHIKIGSWAWEVKILELRLVQQCQIMAGGESAAASFERVGVWEETKEEAWLGGMLLILFRSNLERRMVQA